MDLTLRETVENAISRHWSGAIRVSRVATFVRERLADDLNLKCSDMYGSVAAQDIVYEVDTDMIDPLTEKGWQALEDVYRVDPDLFNVNCQNASHSIRNFRGLSCVKHDVQQIRRDQQLEAAAARWAGYGQSTMGGWIE